MMTCKASFSPTFVHNPQNERDVSQTYLNKDHVLLSSTLDTLNWDSYISSLKWASPCQFSCQICTSGHRIAAELIHMCIANKYHTTRKRDGDEMQYQKGDNIVYWNVQETSKNIISRMTSPNHGQIWGGGAMRIASNPIHHLGMICMWADHKERFAFWYMQVCRLWSCYGDCSKHWKYTDAGH